MQYKTSKLAVGMVAAVAGLVKGLVAATAPELRLLLLLPAAIPLPSDEVEHSLSGHAGAPKGRGHRRLVQCVSIERAVQLACVMCVGGRHRRSGARTGPPEAPEAPAGLEERRGPRGGAGGGELRGELRTCDREGSLRERAQGFLHLLRGLLSHTLPG